MFGLWALARMAGRGGGSSRPRRPVDAKTTWIAWVVLAWLVLSCFWWPLFVLGALAVVVAVMAAGDRAKAVRNDNDRALAELLAKWDEDGRHK